MHREDVPLSALPRPLRLLCAGVLLAGLFPRPLPAQPPITPPFHLDWEKPAIDLEEALLGGSGRIVDRKRIAGGGESWTVEGLPQAALQRVVFHLPRHKLAAVELQYGNPDWTPEQYDGLMQSVKTALEARYGPGILIARKQDTERGVLQTLLGYRWESAGAAIELVYFAAQNPDNLYRAVSLHYLAASPATTSTAAPIAANGRGTRPSSSASAPGSELPPLPPLPTP